MRNMSKRDIKALILLAVFLLLFGLYYWGYKPLKSTNNELQTTLVQTQSEWEKMKHEMSELNRLNELIATQKEEIDLKADMLFVNLDQEEAVYLTESLKGDLPVVYRNYTLSESFKDDKTQKTIEETVDFTANWENIIKVLQSISAYDKKIIVKNLSLKRIDEEQIDTQMTLTFCSLPYLTMLDRTDRDLLETVVQSQQDRRDPFSSYEGYISSEMPSEKIPIPVDIPNEGEIIIQADPYTPIYGFERLGTSFFVGSHPEVLGSVRATSISKFGGHAFKMTYDFQAARIENVANLVFPEHSIYVERKPEKLALWVYSDAEATQSIGIGMIDNNSSNHTLKLTETVDWTGWKRMEVPVPENIAFPVVVKRIYVEATGYDQTISGSYTFDQLEAVY